jgi:hypothetical protein
MVNSPEAVISPSTSGRVQGDLLSQAWSGGSSGPQASPEVSTSFLTQVAVLPLMSVLPCL